MFEKEIVIDAKGHIMGRLGSVIAKELLNGQRVVVVRVEKLVLSGSLFRKQTEYMEFLNKTSSKNPKRGGPYHYKSPSKLFWRTIRGMVPHKTARGKAALERLKVFEGTPYPYSHVKKTCVPAALKTIRLGSNRKFCLLKQLSKHVGWSKGDLVERLEEKREQKAHEYFEKKTKLNNAIEAEVAKLPEVQNLKKQLAAFGY